MTYNKWKRPTSMHIIFQISRKNSNSKSFQKENRKRPDQIPKNHQTGIIHINSGINIKKSLQSSKRKYLHPTICTQLNYPPDIFRNSWIQNVSPTSLILDSARERVPLNKKDINWERERPDSRRQTIQMGKSPG